MHFRKAGIPTWAVSGRFTNPDEMFAHGEVRFGTRSISGSLPYSDREICYNSAA